MANQNPTRSPCALERAAFAVACAAGLYMAIFAAINDSGPDAGATLVSQATTTAAMGGAVLPK